MWCAVANFGVWGLYCFEEEDKAVSVTSDSYVHMLHGFLKTKSKELRNETKVYFQQDGPIAHTSRKTMDLRQIFVHAITFFGVT